MKRLFSTILFSSFVISSLAVAQSSYDGGAGALAGSHDVLTQVINNDLDVVAQSTLNRIVSEGNALLMEQGYAQEAMSLQKEWDHNYSGEFTAVQLFDLGDHQPMNAWLADYYKKLQDKLGAPILRLTHVDDINVLNYAIPVVFQPKGDKRNGDHWNDVEYSKHFIPFISVAAYWAGYVGCRAATKVHPAFKRYCSVAAGALKNLVRSTVAPKLSNLAFAKGTGRKVSDLSVPMARYNEEASRQVRGIVLE
jgi:hypothetical protein